MNMNHMEDDDFQDGWDDDDDDVDNLDLDLEDENDESESAMKDTKTEGASGAELKSARTNNDDHEDAVLSQLNAEIMDTTVEGWDEDDEDILFDDEIESSSQVQDVKVNEAANTVPIVKPAPAPAPPPQKPKLPVSTSANIPTKSTHVTRSAATTPAVEVVEEKEELVESATEGWGDDDDDLFSEESESNVPANNEHIIPTPHASTPAPAVTAQPRQQPGKTLSTLEDLIAASSSFGSSESSNDNDNDNDADKQVEGSDGWHDDADLMFDTVEDEEPDEPRNDMPPSGSATRSPMPPPPPPPKPQSPLYTALEDYLLQLPRLQSSINAVLEYECNTDAKAEELVQYYSTRPGLTEYTIKKELPRMEYTLLQHGGHGHGGHGHGHGPNNVVTTTDKKEIAVCLHQDSLSSSSSLVSRCANQSLLADLLQVFTGSDLLVRPQYMAAAMAVSCRFRLDPSQSLVQVQAQLDLCLPTENGRWKVAELLVKIDFCSHRVNPFVKYQLEAIRPTVQPNDPAWALQLHGVVEMLGHLDLDEHVTDDVLHHPGPAAAMDNNFRDVFLQQSQSIFQNSAVGIKSAWQEIDTVAGFSNKLGRLPRFDDVMQHAEEAAEAEAQYTSSVQERPTSILGGFFGKLAKSVALPDEDPSMYQDWQASAPAGPPAPPVLYSCSPPPSAPRFYNKETPSPQQRPQQPQLYNKITPPPPNRPAVQVPKLYHETPGRPPRGPPTTPLQIAPPQPPSAPTDISALSRVQPPPARAFLEPEDDDGFEPEVEDGWDDDLDLDDDENESVSAPAVPSPPKPHVTEQHIQPVPVKRAPPPIHNEEYGDWVYNPASDIIPTRKRWVNPRPGSRQLRSFAVKSQLIR